MSLGIVIKGPEGVVLAAESRLTLTLQVPNSPPLTNHFDNATKIFDLRGINDYVGVVTWGQAAIGQRPAHSFLPELESELKEKGYSSEDYGMGSPPEARPPVLVYAKEISAFYLQQWQKVMPANFLGPPMTFLVAGFDEGEPYGRVYVIDIPSKPEPDERSVNEDFGMTWGGQIEIVQRLMQGYDRRFSAILDAAKLPPEARQKIDTELAKLALQVPFNLLALQDCVDLALFFIRSTIEAQELTLGVRGCGGPIDVATITRRRGLAYVQRKIVQGEPPPNSRADRKRKNDA